LNKGKLPGTYPQAHCAGRRRTQRLRLLSVGPHLSRQEPRPDG
jgi:hypothetical protein